MKLCFFLFSKQPKIPLQLFSKKICTAPWNWFDQGGVKKNTWTSSPSEKRVATKKFLLLMDKVLFWTAPYVINDSNPKAQLLNFPTKKNHRKIPRRLIFYYPFGRNSPHQKVLIEMELDDRKK